MPIYSIPCQHRHPARSAARGQGLAILLGLALAAPASAADDFMSEEDFLGELPIVLSASRLAQPLREAPGAVTVIDRDMIRASGARSIAELMRWVPGFQVGQRSGYLPLTTYHGLSDDSPRRMLVRVDGRSVYSPYFISGVEWHKLTIDVDDIERIEVFRGSNAAAFGSQAFMGVVNIVTRSAADSPRFSLKLEQGENGIRDRSASLARNFGAAAVRVSVGQEHDEGLAGLADTSTRRRADLRYDWQLALDHRLEVRAGTMELDAQLGVAGEATDPVRNSASHSGFGQVRWQWQPAPEEELGITYLHQSERFRDRFTLDSIEDELIRRAVGDGIPPALAKLFLSLNGIDADSFVDFDYGNRVVRDDLELEHTLLPSRDTRLVWGLGHRQDRLHSKGYFYSDGKIDYDSSRLFANLEWRPAAKWILNGGVMVESGDYVGTLTSPRLAANYHLSDAQTLRAAVSRTQRRPLPFERRVDLRFYEGRANIPILQAFQPSDEVEAEEIRTRELSYVVELRTLRTTLDARIFDEDARKLITFRDEDTSFDCLIPGDCEARKANNDASARIRGAELALTWRPARATWIGVNYTRLHVDSDEDNLAHSAPTHAWSLLSAWTPVPAWQLGLAWHYVGNMRWSTGSDKTVGDYQRIDVRVARRFELGDARAELALVMRALGGNYSDFVPTVEREPTASLMLRLEL